VRHAGLDESDTITITLELGDARLRVEVLDPGEGFAFPVRPQMHDDGRRTRVADRRGDRPSLGIERSEPIAVWFEIDLERASGAPTGARVRYSCVLSSHALTPNVEPIRWPVQ